MKIKLGFSTCPNDTFMFDALVNRKIDTGDFQFEYIMEDILHLNQRAIKGELDLVKISYNTYGKILDHYSLLNSGSALGYKCGPLLISKEKTSIDQLTETSATIAIPGQYTTANLLLGFFAPALKKRKEYLFHEIMPAILNEEVSAGVIIHENRFTYPSHGLSLIQDLGTYWETQTQLPIPLGAIVAKKQLGTEVISQLAQLMQASVRFAMQHPGESMPFVSSHAQEMEPEVMKAHIDLYVNQFSLDLGKQGIDAVEKLLQVGEQMNLYPEKTSARIDLVT